MRIWSESESLSYIQQHNLWDDFELAGVDFIFPLQLFEAEGRIVGGVQGQLANDTFCIGYFFILEERKGYGRQFVKRLKSCYPHLSGAALPSSVIFWKKNGMRFVGSYQKLQRFEYKAGA